MVIIHPHAEERLFERGATREEIVAAVENGESEPALHGRNCFIMNFVFRDEWNGRQYYMKQLKVYAVQSDNDWVVVTVLVNYF